MASSQGTAGAALPAPLKGFKYNNKNEGSFSDNINSCRPCPSDTDEEDEETSSYTTVDLFDAIYQNNVSYVSEIIGAPDADISLTEAIDGNNAVHDVLSQSMWSTLPLLSDLSDFKEVRKGKLAVLQ